jgi:cell division protein FtsZ
MSRHEEPSAGYHANDEPQPSTREAWRAPGNVVIEEGLPQLTTTPRTVTPPVQAAPEPAYSSAPEFAPAPPAEIRRNPAGRRMPEVEDFPVVGQREYRAKAAPGAVAEPATAQSEARRRPGLFDRLTGRSRSADDSIPAAPGSHAPAAPGRPASGTAAGSRSAPGSPQERGSGGARKSQEDVELPVFFSRDRK